MIKQNRTRKIQQNKRSAILLAEILVIIILIAAAFFVPQFIFHVQDAVLCRNTVFSERESTDAEALSTTYEKSLPLRMANFAEGMMGNDNFYVTSQELEVDEEMREFLYSEKGLYSDMVFSLADTWLLPYDIMEDFYYTVKLWKRYVVYSDDFAKGVNFMLWYIEMESEAGELFGILADAEDGTIYAIKTENHYAYSPVEMDELRSYLWTNFRATRLWGFFAFYYQVLDEEERDVFSVLVDKYGWEGSAVDANFFDNGNMDAAVIVREAEQKEKEILAQKGIADIPAEDEALTAEEKMESVETRVQRMVSFHQDDENRMSYRLPYGGAYLEAVIEIEAPGYNIFPEVVIGIRQIYELIPEFA